MKGFNRINANQLLKKPVGEPCGCGVDTFSSNRPDFFVFSVAGPDLLWLKHQSHELQ
jgi:hypothetical protein